MTIKPTVYLVEATCFSTSVPEGVGVEYVGPADTNEQFRVPAMGPQNAAQKVINFCDIDPLQIIAVTPDKGHWLHGMAVTWWRPIDGFAIQEKY
jgi:hypothetical protein